MRLDGTVVGRLFALTLVSSSGAVSVSRVDTHAGPAALVHACLCVCVCLLCVCVWLMLGAKLKNTGFEYKPWVRKAFPR